VTSPIAFFVGLLAFALALYYLYRLRQTDDADAAAALGLALVARGEKHRGATPEGINYYERVIAEGRLHGAAAQLASRVTRSILFPKAQRSVTSFTVLYLRPARRLPVTMRLQPAGVLEQIEHLAHEPPPTVRTGDEAFDASYRIYTGDANAARAALPEDLRAALIALRAAAGVGAPGTISGSLGSAILLGSFDIDLERAAYYVYGSPTTKTAEHIKSAAPLLARLAGLDNG